MLKYNKSKTLSTLDKIVVGNYFDFGGRLYQRLWSHSKSWITTYYIDTETIVPLKNDTLVFPAWGVE